jgi:hypothetical protein
MHILVHCVLDASDAGHHHGYEASMFLLFNLWRKVKELKNGHNSFSKAFAEFEGLMSVKVRERIDHIQLYYECDCSSPNTDGNSLYNKL